LDCLRLHEFADLLGGTLHDANHTDHHSGQVMEYDHTIVEVSVHSGRIGRQTAFFALMGSQTDGHRFIDDAFRNGAVAAVIARTWYERAEIRFAGPVVVVEEPLAALQRLAAWWRTRLTARVIGITGSSGKTLFKDALLQLLSTATRCAASPGSFNSQLGVPLAILGTPRDVDYALFEAGISAPGEMARLEAMIRPDYGVLTNLRWAHIAEFGTRERIAAEKAQLFAHLPPPQGWALLPAGESLLDGLIAGLECPVYRYGGEAGEDLLLPTVPIRRPLAGETVLEVRFPDGQRTDIPVATVLPDALAAIEGALCAGYLLGLSPAQIAGALAHYVPRTTRLEAWKAPNGVTLLHASDNPDPLATRAALRELEGRTTSGGRRLFLLGGLHGLSEAGYAEVGQLSAQHRVDDLLLVGNPAFAATEEAFRTASRGDLAQQGRTWRFDTLPEARAHLLADLKWGDTLLVKGAGLTGIDHLARDILEAMAPNRFYLDLKAVAENVARIRHRIGPRTRILAMLKALAYGSDAVQLSRALQQIGIDQIGVSSADEGRQLREAGVNLPILVMMCTPEEVEKLARYTLTPMIYSFEIAGAIVGAARAQGVPLEVHVEVDTGMGRLGIAPEAVREIVDMIRASGCLRLRGLMTHLAGADDPQEDESTHLQLRRFAAVRAELVEWGYHDLICHAAATAGAIRFPEARLDMVRIGLGLYGLYPSPEVARELELALAVALVSRIVKITVHRQGDRIGYGGTFTVPEDGFRAAVVPMGYHDGLPRALGNVGHVLIQGRPAPICGRISMDSLAVDVSGIPAATVGSDVLLYGERGGNAIRPEETASQCGTIAYELLARLGPRVQRIFLGS
jgi:alanine racemase